MFKSAKGNSSIKLFLLIITAVTAIFFSKEISGGIYKGIYFCAEVLIPSVFPFMIIATAAANSNLSFSGSFLNLISKKLFGLSGKAFTAVIIGVFGGYPVSARGLRTLYDKGDISESEASKAAYTALGAGPGFLITFVGIKLLNNINAGIVLFISQIISVFIIGFFNKILIKSEDYNSDTEIKTNENAAQIFVSSVSAAVYSALEMCAIVCVFSGLLNAAQSFFQSPYLSMFTEVTSACAELSKSGNITAIAFSAGFGGICVHFQVFQALGKIKINKLLYFVFRIIQGFLTALTAYILINIFDITIPVFNSVKDNFSLSLSSTVIGSCLLILTGICFIYNIRED